MAWREGAIPRPELQAFWPMVARASGFVVSHGPRTGQDRWEENSGYTPFTLAVQIAALLAAAELAEACEVDDVAGFLRDTADAWNEQIEDWIYVSDTRLSRECGVTGYYVRIAPEVPGEARAALGGTVDVRNRSAKHRTCRPTTHQPRRTGPGALRITGGRRSADDRHRQGDRSRAAGRPALRAGLAALQRRRLRRARRRQPVRRHRHRPRLAAAGRRAGALRAGGRPPRRGGASAGGAGGGCQSGQAAAGAGVG